MPNYSACPFCRQGVKGHLRFGDFPRNFALEELVNHCKQQQNRELLCISLVGAADVELHEQLGQSSTGKVLAGTSQFGRLKIQVCTTSLSYIHRLAKYIYTP